MFVIQIDQDRADKITIDNLTHTINTILDVIVINDKYPNEDTESENEEKLKIVHCMNKIVEYFGGTKVLIS